MNPFKLLHHWYKRAKNRHGLELMKFLEIELLGRHASTYCYHHPSHVLIEITTRCNLRCGYCNQSDPKWQKEFGHKDMPFEMFETIVKQLKGSRVLLLYNIGEPLLYKRIFDAVALAREYIPEVRLTTNGLLLTADKARKLEKAGLTQLNVSIDGPTEAIMQRNRGAELKKIEDNLLAFGKACKIPVAVWTVVNAVDADALIDLPDWAHKIPAIKSIVFQLQNGVDSSIPALDSREKYKKLQDLVAAKCKAFGLWTNIDALPYYPDGFHEGKAAGICKAPFTQLVAINVLGQLAPCCSYATYGLGDVFALGFKNAWNGEAMRAWRRDMLNQQYCHYCSNWCGFKEHAVAPGIPVKFTTS